MDDPFTKDCPNCGEEVRFSHLAAPATLSDEQRNVIADRAFAFFNIPPSERDEGLAAYIIQLTEEALAHGVTATWNEALEWAAQTAEEFRSNDRAVNLSAREIITGEVAESIASAIREGMKRDGTAGVGGCDA